MIKVALIEDDQNLQHLLKTLLELENFQVKVINHATGNLYEEIRSDPPAILIMDAHLGHVDGLEVLNTLRQDPQFIKMQILITSGENLKTECLNSGANGFLLKPYTPSELITWLHAG